MKLNLFVFFMMFVLFSSCNEQINISSNVQEEIDSNSIRTETIDKTKSKETKDDTELKVMKNNSDTIKETIEKIETEKLLETEQKEQEELKVKPVINDQQSIKSVKPEPKEISIEKIVTVNNEENKALASPHHIWDELTRNYINSEGKVNYGGFLFDNSKLEHYLDTLKKLHSDLPNWSKNKQLAYWINLYNAVTVKLIVDHYPVSSITELKGGKPWDTPLIELSGNTYTLNVIENEIIRPKFKEPRIHFALNCAAKSCPKIMNKAWTEDNLKKSLTTQIRSFLTDKKQNTLGKEEIIISKIFDWYKADFGTTNEKIIQFINAYSEIEVNESASVIFNEYDWTLNSK